MLRGCHHAAARPSAPYLAVPGTYTATEAA